MTIYRNKKDKGYKTYSIAKITGRRLGGYYESTETVSGKKRRLNQSSHRLKDFYAIAEQ